MATLARLDIFVDTLYAGDYVELNLNGELYKYIIGTALNQWDSATDLLNLIKQDAGSTYNVTLNTATKVRVDSLLYGDDRSFTSAKAGTANGSGILFSNIPNVNPTCSLLFQPATIEHEYKDWKKGKITAIVNNATFLGAGSDVLGIYYSFSLDGINYQDSGTFENLSAGVYTVYAKDKRYSGNSCIATQQVTVEFKIPYKATRIYTANCSGYYEGSNTAVVTSYSDYSSTDADVKAYNLAKSEAEAGLICTLKPNLFVDVPVGSKSFTLSYSFLIQNWCIFHDYEPDYLFSLRSGLMSFKSNKIYRHNLGEYGQFYDGKYPFFVDIVINEQKTLTKILDTVMWMSEVTEEEKAIRLDTFDYISIWNHYSASGKLPISKTKLHYLQEAKNSNVEGTWIFNEFDDIVINPDEKFVSDLPNNYIFINSNLDEDRAWFDKQLLSGKFFIIRLEYSNTNNRKINLVEIDANLSQSVR